MNESGMALVVEDEKDIQKLLAIILMRQGYDVLCCEDGLTAEKIFEEHWQFVRLALIDKKLPNFNLLEFCKRLRVRRPDLPIVVQTGGGLDSDEDLQTMLDIGVAVLMKPYLPDDLWQAVQVAGKLADSAHSKNQY